MHEQIPKPQLPTGLPSGYVLKTSILRQNDVAMSFWCDDDIIITPCVHWVVFNAIYHQKRRSRWGQLDG